MNQYQRGTIRYHLPTLSEGKYQLKLKAWDMVNNSNQAFLDFVVHKQEKLTITNVRNYPNPFRANGGSTTFAFEHNQPNAEILVSIQIVNSAGALVKTEGKRNSSGIYYRVIISTLNNPILSSIIKVGQIIID